MVLERIRKRLRRRHEKKLEELRNELNKLQEYKAELIKKQRSSAGLLKTARIAYTTKQAYRKKGLLEYFEHKFPFTDLLAIEYPHIRRRTQQEIAEIAKELKKLEKLERKIKHKIEKLERKLAEKPKKEKVERPILEALEAREAKRERKERIEARAEYVLMEVNISRDTSDSRNRTYEIDFTVYHLYLPADITDEELMCILDRAIRAITDAWEGLDDLLAAIPLEDINLEILDTYNYKPHFEPRAIASVVIKPARGRSRRYDATFIYDECIKPELRSPKPPRRFKLIRRHEKYEEPTNVAVRFLRFLRR